MSIQGKVAVVTGAASGMGRSIAELFARNGARVVAVDRDHSVIERPPPGITLSMATDVSIPVEVVSLYKRISAELNACDILVNAAGIIAFGGTEECTEDDWDRVLAINAKGVWLMCREALKLMVDQNGGVIVNIASAAGLRPRPGLLAYCASKAAVISVTRSISVEYAQRGIRANCICPGVTDTPMHQFSVAQNKAHGSAERARNPELMQRMAQPEEIAAAALFLASPECGYVTGAVIAVDGGRTLH